MSTLSTRILQVTSSRFVKIVGGLAGATVGFGVLAFVAGFLAQRAQYDFAQVPFVFIDYWAYAETGLLGLLASITMLLEAPFLVALLVLSSIGLIFVYPKILAQPWVASSALYFAAYVVVAFCVTLLLAQQLGVHRLRSLAASAADASDGFVGPDTVPSIMPFTLLVDRRTLPPDPQGMRVSGPPAELFEVITSHLERDYSSDTLYLKTRPRDAWNLVAALAASGAPGADDSRRARQLYVAILSAFAACVWLFGILSIWGRLVRPQATSDGKDDAAPFQTAFFRCATWIVKPLVLVMLIVSGGLLLPECYGLLAMPQLGHEFVQVVLATDEKQSAGTNASQSRDGRLSLDATSDWSDEERDDYGMATDGAREAVRLISDYSSVASLPDRASLLKKWGELVSSIETSGHERSGSDLQSLVDMTSGVAPELVQVTQDALARMSRRTRRGFILYYPRSETDHLRLIQENVRSQRERWTIQPVDLKTISEIRVMRDERTGRLVSLLRELPNLDPDDRRRALVMVEITGHPNLLEIALVGSVDPSPRIRGFSITDVGRYASALPDSAHGRFRREVAVSQLLWALGNASERGDFRGAAASSLVRVAKPREPRVCDAFADLLRSAVADGSAGEWEMYASITTAAGTLQCDGAAEAMVHLLREKDRVPEFVRANIPTALTGLTNGHVIVEHLAAVANDPDELDSVKGTTLTALGRVKASEKVMIDALATYLTSSRATWERETTNRVNAVWSLYAIGSTSCRAVLMDLAVRTEPDPEVRKAALSALDDLGDYTAEDLFLRIALDDQEDRELRARSVSALGGTAGAVGLEELRRLFWSIAFSDDPDPALMRVIMEAMKERSSGSTRAARHLREMLTYVAGLEDAQSRPEGVCDVKLLGDVADERPEPAAE